MSTVQILTTPEIRNYESPPHFDSFQRKKFFTLPSGLMNEVESLRNSTSQIAFILQCGYFRASLRFFGNQFYPNDITFLAHRSNITILSLLEIPKQTLNRHRQIITEFFGYRRLTGADKENLKFEIAESVNRFHRPTEVFRHTVKSLQSGKFILPGYDFLATVISREIFRQKQKLNQIIKDSLSTEQKQLLDSLLEKEEINNEVEFRAKLTLLKNPSQSLKAADIKSNLNDWNILQSVYDQVSNVIVRLNLSSETLRYYANAVLKSEIFQISRQKDETKYLHLLAFIASQTFRYQDIVVDSFLLTVQTVTNSATQELREKLFRERQEKRHQMRTFLLAVDSELLKPLLVVEQIAASGEFSAEEKLIRINSVLETFNHARPNVEGQISQILADTDSDGAELEFYNILRQKSLTLQKRTADIIRLLRVDEKSVNQDLFKALQHFQATDGNLDGHAPQEFLSDKEQKAISSGEPKFPVSLYKILLFQKIAQGIKSGKVNFNTSHKYRSLEDYLIPFNEWNSHRAELLEQAEISKSADLAAVRFELSRLIHQRFLETNRKLKDNIWFKRKSVEDWFVTTPPLEKSEFSGLKNYFPRRQLVPLGEVFSTVNQATAFLDELRHWQNSTKQKRPSNRSFCAAIIGFGCEIGIGKISHIAKNTSESELENAVNWYLSNENLLAANSHLLDFIGNMELPNLYRRNPEKLHTSSDGQKYAVSVPSLNANYSFKYFGQEKGVSVYSFIDERHLLFYSTVISSSEREAAYVIDGLLHNETIKSDIHSTDSHGFTEVVFAVTHLLGFTFAPRLKTLCKHQLYSFEKRKNYAAQNCSILPDAYINTEIIAENWDSILRFVATIKLKRAFRFAIVQTAQFIFQSTSALSSLKRIRQNHQNFIHLKICR